MRTTSRALLAALLLLAGCSGGGIDRWPEAAVKPAIASLTPPDDTCYALPKPGERRKVVPCSANHVDEVIHVGLLKVDEKRDGEVAPEHFAAPMIAAGKSCEAAARQFLGGDVMLAPIRLKTEFPTPPQWEAGHRWFACELAQVGDKRSEIALDGREIIERTGSLRDGLRGAAPLARHCYSTTEANDLVPLACSAPHTFEFAGLAETPRPASPSDPGKSGTDVCLPVIAAYVGVTAEQYAQVLGYAGFFVGTRADEVTYVYGCYAWSDSVKIRGSVKGLGRAVNRTRITA
jgi:hypothetical protein